MLSNGSDSDEDDTNHSNSVAKETNSVAKEAVLSAEQRAEIAADVLNEVIISIFETKKKLNLNLNLIFLSKAMVIIGNN